MNNNNNFIDWVNILSLGISLYSLYIALENLTLNDSQSKELKEILNYLEQHLKEQDKHLLKQDELIKKIMKGD